MDQRPIGVFDSGSGGLTAVREIRSILPSENIIYFGDTTLIITFLNENSHLYWQLFSKLTYKTKRRNNF